jgi:hypothetical protein
MKCWGQIFFSWTVFKDVAKWIATAVLTRQVCQVFPEKGSPPEMWDVSAIEAAAPWQFPCNKAQRETDKGFN